MGFVFNIFVSLGLGPQTEESLNFGLWNSPLLSKYTFLGSVNGNCYGLNHVLLPTSNSNVEVLAPKTEGDLFFFKPKYS